MLYRAIRGWEKPEIHIYHTLSIGSGEITNITGCCDHVTISYLPETNRHMTTLLVIKVTIIFTCCVLHVLYVEDVCIMVKGNNHDDAYLLTTKTGIHNQIVSKKR